MPKKENRIKNLMRRLCLFLMTFIVMSLVGCVNQAIANATPAISPTLTDTVVTSASAATATATGAIFPTVSPIATLIPLFEIDDPTVQLKDLGYRLLSSSSLIGPEGFTYFADLFINPELSPLMKSSDANENALLVAFYRVKGEKRELISVQGFPAVDHNYAVGANAVNWDEPFSETMLLDVFATTDEETRRLLNQDNYSSDINQNDLPEFAFVVEYCPISCTHPTGGVQLFEIQNHSTIKNITQDLPGLTDFGMHSKKPFTFYVEESDFYDIYLDITSVWIYTWDGSKFVDVSVHYADEYLAKANSIIGDLKSQYGKPFGEKESKSEMDVIRILKLYEKAGRQKEGLKVFLDITDISHWPNTSELSQCWLQISRAMAQEAFAQNRKFDLPPGSSYWEQNLDIVKSYEEPLKQAGYDTSACAAINP